MTAKQLYKYVLVELGKVNAPAVKLYEFNYFCNKAIQQYINMWYASYDMQQITTDSLRVLQASAYMTPQKIAKANNPLVSSDYTSTDESLYGAAYECYLPMDYMHLLNCICTFEAKQGEGCYEQGGFLQRSATRLTSDSWNMVMDDYYNRPSIDRPYYQIYNQNRNLYDVTYTDPVEEVEDAKAGQFTTKGTDAPGVYGVDEFDSDTLAKGEEKGTNFKRTFTFGNGVKESVVERTATQRIGNASSVRLEIRYGRDDSQFVLREVQVDYIKAPQYIRLSQEQLDLTQDVSQILEWPEFVCFEIINIITRLLMLRSSDPRMVNYIQMDTTIASPGVVASTASTK